MKINSNYKVREMAGENVIVKQGKTGADLTKIISLNSTALELYNEFSGKEFEASDVERYLVETYEIDVERAKADAASWIKSLNDCDLII